jgi:hypothetical protein
MGHHQLPINYLQRDQPLNGWSRRLHLHRTRVRMVGRGRGWAGCVVDRPPSPVLPPGPVLPVHLEFSADMLTDALRAARLVGSGAGAVAVADW